MAGIKRVFWDIETSPNVVFSWRTGRKINIDHDNIIHERAIICICWKYQGQKRVHSLTWDRGDDSRMLEEFARVIEEADELVAHNGDKFDMRWFNGRRLIHGMLPIPSAKTVDTYKMAARHFNLNSYRLDYLGRVLLGEGKIGVEFDLWKRIALYNDESAMKKMVRYCKKDVALLERVWDKLRDYGAPHTHAAVAATGNNKDRWMCPHCGSTNVKKNKTRSTAKGMVQHQMKCGDCHRYYSIADSVFGWYVCAKYRSGGGT